ncbi:MAG: sigma-54-dependent Fis family transcriptional regulator [Flavobacteriales bacterium]|nr:MAG: sigma-54-dependent Fis family transcriptional regulator [Flavobacteriales bacterium]
MDIQVIKQRFSIIGNSPLLGTALETAIKVSPTDMNVLILGESGVGKESFSKIIHHLSGRKHAPFIAVNCGAIPEGTIDSELFGHEKGAFTGAMDKRKGYFETVSGGTIFLDEVGELPLSTQARLLRILENGEFIKVGSSVVQKTDVRVVAATNRDLLERSRQGKFREDLYYRLATVPIRVPKLCERPDDIYLLFRKFASDFAETHHSKLIELTPEAQFLLTNYPWPGNVRQLKNVSEQICVLESSTLVDAEIIAKYLPQIENPLPMLLGKIDGTEGMSERDIFYKVLIDMRRDVNDLKKVVFGLFEGNLENLKNMSPSPSSISKSVATTHPSQSQTFNESLPSNQPSFVIQAKDDDDGDYQESESYSFEGVNNLSLEAQEIQMIKRSLNKNNGKRKKAADELGISERTLYRKIKQYRLE